MIEVEEFEIKVSTDIEIEVMEIYARKVKVRWRSGGEPTWTEEWMTKGDVFAIDRQHFTFKRDIL